MQILKPDKMKHWKIATLLCLLTLFLSFTIASKGDLLIKKITQQIQKFTLQAPQEKVYLHFDKPYYMAGETMWFKGYLLYAYDHNIDSASHILYVDLVDPTDNKIIQHLKLNCSQGVTNGAIQLSDSLPEGNYLVRAYTSFMQNYSEDFFFKKDIKIWQNKQHITHTESELQVFNTVADCQFFPEGGNLVSGINSRVGFKAVNQLGQGVYAEGFILDDNQDTMAIIKTEHRGLGVFSFIPNFGKHYKAFIKKPDGSLAAFELPKIYEKGYALFVDNLSNKENIKVIVNNSQPKSPNEKDELVVIGQIRGSVCFHAVIPNDKSSIPLSISRASLPNEGIMQITLFNTDGTPLCERLIFIKKEEQQVFLKIETDKSTYGTREKTTLNIEATDESGEAVEGNFSLAVTDGQQVIPPQYENNILSYMLLSSDLKGYIEDPAYYFTETNKSANRHLDYLMMTQGWRRFTWKEVLEEQYPKQVHPVEQGFYITGRVLKPNKTPYPDAKLSFYIKSSDNDNPQLETSTTDAEGRFGFYNLQFNDTCQFFIQALKETGGRNLELMIDTIALAPLSQKMQMPSQVFDFKQYETFLKQTADNLAFEKQISLSKDKMLPSLEVKAKKTQKIDYRRGKYASAGDLKSIEITTENCYKYADIGTIILEKIPGVQIRYGARTFSAISRTEAMSFWLDGFYIGLNFETSSIRPCEIEMIDVLRGPEAAIFGIQAAGGVVNIITRLNGSTNVDVKQPTPGVFIGRKVGYTTTRVFYETRYDIAQPAHDLPDFRSTLHWQPVVKTDASGKATVAYWNSDAKGKMQVSIQGFSNTGRLGMAKFEYEVR